MTARNLGLIDVSATAAPTAGCGCCATTDATERTVDQPSDVPADVPADTVDTADTAGVVITYGVAGMTCGHCVGAVTTELGALAGVRAVDVRLVAGGTSSVTVISNGPLDDAVVGAAVDEAGYDLIGRLG